MIHIVMKHIQKYNEKEHKMSNKKEPNVVALKKDGNYAWCACSLSSNQPFCDGSHAKTDLKPTVFKAEETKDAHLCGCKESSNAPYCDGTHLSL
jgi:CDGSH-type Zn-finger protein|tara:strand:- start:787 stop:1068 length:282 start_codon:yes stop_codon:yes gene_type:complete